MYLAGFHSGSRARPSLPSRFSYLPSVSRSPLALCQIPVMFRGEPLPAVGFTGVRLRLKQTGRARRRSPRYRCNSTACSRRGLVPLRVGGEVGGRQAELMSHKADHSLRRLLGRSHAKSRIPLGGIAGRRIRVGCDDTKRREIAESVVSGRKSGAEMARLYDVSQPTVSRIVAMHLAGRAQRAVLNKSASDP
jgi:hypothetical protein